MPDEQALYPTLAFWAYIGGGVGMLLICSATAAINVALLELDATHLAVLKRSASPAVQRQVAIAEPLLRRHHLVVLSLVLLHAVCDEALPIMLEGVAPNEFYALAGAVPLVLLFGELVPAVVVTGRPLLVLTTLAPLAWLIVGVTGIISAPLAWLTHRISGHDDKLSVRSYRRHELSAFLRLHVGTGSAADAEADAGPGAGAPDTDRKRRKQQPHSLRALFTGVMAMGRFGRKDVSSDADGDGHELLLLSDGGDREMNEDEHDKLILSIAADRNGRDQTGAARHNGHNAIHIQPSAPGHSPFGPQRVREPSSAHGAHAAEDAHGHQSHSAHASGEHALTSQEVRVLEGALSLATRRVCDRMVPIASVFSLSSDDVLTPALVHELAGTSHSRIPVHEGNDKGRIVGLLLVKLLLRLDNNGFGLRVGSLPLLQPLVLHPQVTMLEALRLFEEHRTHMAVVAEDASAVRDVLALYRQAEERRAASRDEACTPLSTTRTTGADRDEAAMEEDEQDAGVDTPADATPVVHAGVARRKVWMQGHELSTTHGRGIVGITTLEDCLLEVLSGHAHTPGNQSGESDSAHANHHSNEPAHVHAHDHLRHPGWNADTHAAVASRKNSRALSFHAPGLAEHPSSANGHTEDDGLPKGSSQAERLTSRNTGSARPPEHVRAAPVHLMSDAHEMRSLMSDARCPPRVLDTPLSTPLGTPRHP